MERLKVSSAGATVVVVCALSLAACGTTDDGPGGTMTGATSDEAGRPSTTSTTSAETTTSPEPSETGSTSTDDPAGTGVEPTLAGGSDEVLDLVLGRLDSATLDGRSQCLLDAGIDDVAGQAGLRPGNRSHMLADGHDVWVVCLTTTVPPDGSTLSLTDSTGTRWGEGELSVFGEPVAQRQLGFAQEGTSARGVAVTDGPTLVPVGHTYERVAADATTYMVTTLNLVVPTTRPAGPWTVTVSSEALQVDTPACQVARPAPQRPWPVDPGLRVVTFADLNQLDNAMWAGELPDDLWIVDHCLATPLLVGHTWKEAAGTVEATRLAAGLAPGETTVELSCVDGSSGVVRHQNPLPNEKLRDRTHLFADFSCPPMADLVGLPVSEAESRLAEMGQPPYSFGARSSGQCADPGAVVTRTSPAVGGTSYLVNINNVLMVDIFC